MRVKMNGYTIQASEECISELLLALCFALDKCEEENLPNLYKDFGKMHSDLFDALSDCGYFIKTKYNGCKEI